MTPLQGDLNLNARRHDRIQEIFWAAWEMRPEARADYVLRACGDEQDIRGEVERLLSSFERAGETADVAHAPDFATPAAPTEGDHIGPYRILRELGRGGMGAVYLAARDDREYEQRVAIKLIRAGVGDGMDAMARFRRERQILADLIHANIARLLSGGVTENGHPYLVMEYIEGLTIDDYCRVNSLSTRARIELMLGICAAVQFAHRNLVVHRDIKPSNILVTDEGVPKLVDFGIAKLLRKGPAARLTEPAQRVMTMEYASPEQIRGEPITTATDIYSLGTVLYELLAGKLPFEVNRMNALEAQKSICETAPRPPSAVVDRTAERQALRGDLDNIVLMAMRKEPAERYASVEQMSDDLRRYLDGFPVIASRGTWRYRAGKFVRRHWLGVAAAAMVFLAVTGFGIGMAALAARVTRERDHAAEEAATARAVSNFLIDLFQKFDPAATQGDVKASDLLKQGKDRVEHELGNQPELRARLLDNIGRAYNTIGPQEEAVKAFRESLDVRTRLHGGDAPGSDVSWSGLSDAYYNMGRYDDSLAAGPRALAIRKRNLDPDDDRISAALAGIARTLAQQEGNLREAERTMAQAIEIDRRKGRLSTPDGADRLHTYGMVLQKEGKLQEALPVLREAADLLRAADGELGTAEILNQLGIVENLLGRPREGEQTLRHALVITKQVYGAENVNVGVNEANLAESLVDLGRYAEAEALARDGIRLFVKSLGAEHPQLVFLEFALGEALDGEGRHAEAEKVFHDALVMIRKVSGEKDSHTIHAELELGIHDEVAGNARAAIETLEPALDAYAKAGRASTRQYYVAERSLGQAYASMGRVAEAEKSLRESADGLRTQLGEESTETKRSEKALAAVER